MSYNEEITFSHQSELSIAVLMEIGEKKRFDTRGWTWHIVMSLSTVGNKPSNVSCLQTNLWKQSSSFCKPKINFPQRIKLMISFKQYFHTNFLFVKFVFIWKKLYLNEILKQNFKLGFDQKKTLYVKCRSIIRRSCPDRLIGCILNNRQGQ